jgi:hypothetical protein
VLADRTAALVVWSQVFRTVADVHFFVIGSLEENELVLWSVLTTYIETISLILKYAHPNLRRVHTMRRAKLQPPIYFRNQVDKRTLSENFDFLLLAMDELVDDGYEPSDALQRPIALCCSLKVSRSSTINNKQHQCRVVMETEPQVIADRVCMRSQGPDGRGEDAIMGVPMKTINSAKDMVVKGLGNLRAQGV